MWRSRVQTRHAAPALALRANTAKRRGPPRGLGDELGDQMNADQGLFVPLILGILEGLTEFLPVSSTGHLLLAGHFFGLSQPATFVVLIQLGAILAVISVYFAKLGLLIRDALTGKAYAWHFALAVVIACLPAVVIGMLLRDFIQQVIYETPLVICISLLVGGIVLLIVDRMPKRVVFDDIYTFPWHLALVVGLFQVLSLVPGVSRSGSTVVGAMLFGASKRSAAEFTFFIALPIMAGAFGYDLYKSRDLIRRSGAERRHRLRRRFRCGCLGGALPAGLCLAPRLCTIRLVAHPGGRRRPDCDPGVRTLALTAPAACSWPGLRRRRAESGRPSAHRRARR